MTWFLDPRRSDISFRINHLLCVVEGRFTCFDLTPFDKALDQPVKLLLESSSVKTGNKSRDRHLQTADFFNSLAFPFIQFVSTSIIHLSTDILLIDGHLTIKALNIPIRIKAYRETLYQKQDLQDELYYKLEAELSRSKCGLTWNGLTNDLQVILGDKIRISANLFFSVNSPSQSHQQ